MEPLELSEPTARSRKWASTMAGFPGEADAEGEGGRSMLRDGKRTSVRVAHADSHAQVSPSDPGTPDLGAERGFGRAAREDREAASLAPGATLAGAAGDRILHEDPDPWRTCFERDRDRILHATAFRRLAGKTQVFVFAEDHQRTRLTHALEVAQVATSVARACRLNVALTEAIALGHDCGHGPGGHASEDALDPYLAGGFDHAPWGADVSLSSLNLCRETSDGIRNHSWSRPAPRTPEGEVVSWSDRIAYLCHDWEDAVHAGIVPLDALPESVRRHAGATRSGQLGTFIDALVTTILETGQVGMDEENAACLAAFRRSNYERIYLRDASIEQGRAVVAVLQALVDHYADQPNAIPAVRSGGGFVGGSTNAVTAAVTYVAGMTDRFAFRCAVAVLGWDPAKLPRGVGS
jgi:dGTPase